jgi:L-ascorbate metabolism protein UlaG (beta-lactamase superfamily)
MRITHLGHACLLVEAADARILIDPGSWSPAAADQRDLNTILITHQHADHVDQDRLPELLKTNADARVLADPETAAILQGKGIDAESFGDGAQHQVGEATVTAVGEMHALIHDEIPRIRNTGMRISANGEPTLFHPGDALDGAPGEVDVLAFPLNAPWARSRDMTGFLRRINPPHALPIHDALLSKTGRTLYLRQAGQLGGAETRIHDLADGAPADFTA